ncbi:NAD(P)H-binding protein [Pseudomonas protegens]|uniref:NAD(P)H-binding protein n=1 Tax=Pseudomonas protegens TaxID=380021 RepID=UPI002A3706B8|nr:NAD(P)H-binding protein [Pseudomonas protegens]MDX9681376.1 NAD(P)H-binding protein [Pseudomonas protegens]
MRAGVMGLVGAYGSVGRQVAQLLAGKVALRLGGRDPRQAEQLNQQLGARAEVRALDLWEPQSLADFCAGCSLVINCAGPSGFSSGGPRPPWPRAPTTWMGRRSTP